MRIGTIVGLLLLVGIFLVDLGPNLHLIIDPLAIAFVIVGTLGLTLASFPPCEIRRAVATGARVWFSRKPSVEGEAAATFYRRVAVYAQVMGWIGLFFGLVIMMEKGVFADPEVWQSGLRVCFLTVLYGLVIAYAVCMPIRTHLERKPRAEGEA